MVNNSPRLPCALCSICSFKIIHKFSGGWLPYSCLMITHSIVILSVGLGLLTVEMSIFTCTWWLPFNISRDFKFPSMTSTVYRGAATHSWCSHLRTSRRNCVLGTRVHCLNSHVSKCVCANFRHACFLTKEFATYTHKRTLFIKLSRWAGTLLFPGPLTSPPRCGQNWWWKQIDLSKVTFTKSISF